MPVDIFSNYDIIIEWKTPDHVAKTCPNVALAGRDASTPRNEQSATRYIKSLTPRERVDMVLSDLREHHRWSMKDLIYHMVHAPPEIPYGSSEKRRARLLSQAIYGQPEVVSQLASVSKDIYTIGLSEQASRLQSELKGLDVLGDFELYTDPEHVDVVPALATRAQSKAPELWSLLVGIMTPPRGSRDTATVYPGSILMICSMLAFAFAPRKSNNFPTLLGLYLHANGVKRRVISLLSGLGIITAYKTIMDRRKKLADLGQR
ncbi:uncharacterized protein N7515_002595 [Penicillium bovifimosum]|uniref:Uncharacterized protein n=1 Tax=Penicillium bovifimosum TaxID=126998 RepID=A0A9W9L9E9_9EURO|nr:uncharacterized protein N7515_002595 [Penicillium bovifimosum]KAJ5143808.1 hypothetical protein N7515_002595 [Penicillium bovifimosum]